MANKKQDFIKCTCGSTLMTKVSDEWYCLRGHRVFVHSHDEIGEVVNGYAKFVRVLILLLIAVIIVSVIILIFK